MSEHYFSTAPTSALTYAPVTVAAWGQELRLVSASGLFSYGRLDLGTSVLLRSASPAPGARTLLDLGCGWGPLAVLLSRTVRQACVWAIDVNERALSLTAQNAASAGVGDHVRPVAPDDVPESERFDEIWSNPPIRVGKEALHAMLLRWLPRLEADGRALLVVGRNLGSDSLQRWLRDEGYSCERLASAKGFRVLEVRPAEAGLTA